MIQASRTRAELVRQHLEALRISSMVTGWYRKSWEPNVEHVTPEGVIEALNRAGIRPVLMGAHGIGGYRSEARSTQDVDVLVTKRDVRKAVRVLEEAFPYLEPIDSAVVTRFRNWATLKVELDVMKPTSRAMQVVFRNTIAVGDTHRIPTLEMALASKFVAIVSSTRRQAKKQVDLGDFIDVIEHNREVLDLKKLKRLGDDVYPNGGERILRMVEDIDAGRTIHL